MPLRIQGTRLVKSSFTLISHKAVGGPFPVCKMGHPVLLSGLVTIREEKRCGRGILYHPWNRGLEDSCDPLPLGTPPSGPHSAGQDSCDLAESRHLEEEVALGKMCKRQ